MIKKRVFIGVLFWVAVGQVGAHVAYPGGVASPFVRSVAQQGDAFFDATTNRFSIMLPSRETEQFTVFVVYRHIQTDSEQTVWSVSGESGTSLVMTTERLQDLRHTGYIHHAIETRPQYRILTYIHNRCADTENRLSENLWFTIGTKPSNPTVSARDFSGYIPEIILYDRVLNPAERRRVESYLAIKYGISLSQVFPTSYFNSQGDIIWNATRENRFNQNIAAIGRDDGSGLLQKTSSSSSEQSFLTMSLSQRELANNRFLFWADNGGGMHFAPQYGGWRKSQKVWQLQKTEAIQGHSIVQDFDLTNIANRRLGDGERYALMIDHSASGNFPVGQVSFVEVQPQQNNLQFSNIDWGRNGGKAVFALAIIPKDFIYSDENCVGCHDDKLLLETPATGTNFSHVHLSPNPTSDGEFWLDIALHEKANVDIRIYTVSGVFVSERRLRGSAFYLYRGRLPHTGSYIIQLVSNGTAESLTIIKN